jgi:hypothetical protein
MRLAEMTERHIPKSETYLYVPFVPTVSGTEACVNETMVANPRTETSESNLSCSPSLSHLDLQPCSRKSALGLQHEQLKTAYAEFSLKARAKDSLQMIVILSIQGLNNALEGNLELPAIVEIADQLLEMWNGRLDGIRQNMLCDKTTYRSLHIHKCDLFGRQNAAVPKWRHWASVPGPINHDALWLLQPFQQLQLSGFIWI